MLNLELILLVFIVYVWVGNSILLNHLYKKNLPEYKREKYHFILIIFWPLVLPFLLRHILFRMRIL